MNAGKMAAGLLLAGVLGCAARPAGTLLPAPVSANPAVQELAGVADLAGRFDRDRAHPRIVLLLSPT